MVIDNGYISEKIPQGLDLVAEIKNLKKQKGAVILAHYYTSAEIQDIADFIGDSLALSEKAAQTSADIILFAGVHFMAETAKVLSPDKKVLIPDLNARCSLADSCRADEFGRFIDAHPDHIVVSYVNTTIGVKALTDICCTSSNAVKIIESIPLDQKIIFAPDRNLGNYLKSVTGRDDMVVWDGACHVHEEFSVEKILELKSLHPDAKVVAHPECKKSVLLTADFIGSTAAILKFCSTDSAQKYIVVTESGILHQMAKDNPSKTFIPAPPVDSTCGCNDCAYMKLVTLQKVYLTLKYEQPEVLLNSDQITAAQKSIKRMLEIG